LIERGTAIALLLSLSLFGLARASTGGPQEIRFLGYEQAVRTVFFAVFDFSESGQEPQIFSIRVDSLGHGAPRWIAPPTFRSSDPRNRVDWAQTMMDSLRGVLTSPDTLSRASSRVRVRPLSEWLISPANSYPRRPQYVVNVAVECAPYSGAMDLSTFCDRHVTLKEVWMIPGSQLAVARLSYTGLPYESCYESDVLLLLKAPAKK